VSKLLSTSNDPISTLSVSKDTISHQGIGGGASLAPSARTHPVAVGTTSQYFRRLIYIVSIEAFEVPNHSLIFLSNLRHFIEIREKLERTGDNLGGIG